MKKITPCLSAFFIDHTMGPSISLAQVHTMRAEVKALLRVARAAKRISPHTIGDKSRYEALWNALSALNRVSR
jgi:hypothetical protein